MKILVLDNYDSFTYNLVHLLYELGLKGQVAIHRNDQIALEAVADFDKILLSPGPGIPSEAGIMQALIRQYAATKSILGVCLGHQGIAECFGATLVNLPEVLHGIADQATLLTDDEPMFAGLPSAFKIGHYHSWAVQPTSVGSQLQITAIDERGQVMALRHRTFDVRGVQFHPESVLTEYGKEMLANWLGISPEATAPAALKFTSQTLDH